MIIPFNCKSVRLTSPYGYRTLNGKRDYHGGYDLVGVGSTDIVAAVPGKVVRSRIVTDKNNSTWQWGNYVCVRAEDGTEYYYCHMSSRAVKEGDTVKAGDKLGVMGNTGYSFGAHLHFEVRKNSEKINPETVLGIANKTGTYKISAFEDAINTLYREEVINSPEYWLKREHIDTYFSELMVKCADKIGK